MEAPRRQLVTPSRKLAHIERAPNITEWGRRWYQYAPIVGIGSQNRIPRFYVSKVNRQIDIVASATESVVVSVMRDAKDQKAGVCMRRKVIFWVDITSCCAAHEGEYQQGRTDRQPIIGGNLYRCTLSSHEHCLLNGLSGGRPTMNRRIQITCGHEFRVRITRRGDGENGYNNPLAYIHSDDL